MDRSLIITALFTGLTMLPEPAQGTDSSVPFINADQVHAQGYSGQGVTVAVIDTGIYYGEHGLLGSIAPGGISIIGGQPINDGGADIYGIGHGTYMSLIITDMTGVAPNARILPIRVFGPGGGATYKDIEMAIDYVRMRKKADPSIRVINLSLGDPGWDMCPCDDATPGVTNVSHAITDASSSGIITFAATGNEAVCGGIAAPACVSDAIPVAAAYDGYYNPTYFDPPADCGDISPDPWYVTCFSNHMEDCDGLSAPGYDITVGGFSTWGTSQATAHCSGVGALMFDKNACGTLDAYEARAIIFNTAWDIWFAYPYCPLPPPPRHVNALPAVNTVSAGTCPLPGDLDCDGFIDLTDFEAFAQCLTGPDGGPVVGSCVCADFPESPPDGDIDLRDFAGFQRAFTGPGEGACCHSDASCTEGPVDECTEVFDATYQGHGTTCATTDCPLPNWGACCDPDDRTCTESTEEDCVWGWGFYQGHGTTCATATCPSGRYRNVIDPLTVYVLAESGLALADVMTLSSNGTCQLAFYDLGVYGGGGGTFDLTAGIYNGYPGSGGTLIPGTQFTWTDNPDDGSPVFLQAVLDPPVTIPDTVWMVATFSRPEAGWFRAEAAEVGYTENYFARYDPPWNFYWWGGDPYAGLWADLGCGLIPGDFDGDGDVDLDDYAEFPGCMTGPNNPPVDEGCEVFDFEPDIDVDLADFAAFQEAFSR